MNQKLKFISKVTSFVFAILFGLSVVTVNICMDNSAQINSFLKVETFRREDKNPADDKTDSMYYKSSFESVSDVLESGEEYCRTMVEEGAVLLKNENVRIDGENRPALPLGENAGVSLFSASSVYPVLCGTGSSSANKTTAGNNILKNGFTAAGLNINTSLYNWYMKNTKYCRLEKNSLALEQNEINDAKWSDIPDNVKYSAGYDDAAIFILSRSGGESLDLARTTGDKSDMTDGDYLVLSPTERDVLENLKRQKENGKFKRIIVVLNSAYHVTGFVDDERYGIDAMLWAGSFGSEGAEAVGNILSGRVNPSGRLSDTYYTNNAANPASYNFGKFLYTNENKQMLNHTGDSYVVYQEGIYVGYRYTETRYADLVSGVANVGDYDYFSTVEYPFGYGLSYTKFEYDDFDVSYDKASDTYTVSVKVTNTGEKAGKETVQIYLQKPFTDYDRENRIEKSAVDLVGFAKTKSLKARESERVSVAVSGREFASYDSYGKGTYIVDAGEYLFTAGKDAHDATNNLLAYRGKTTADGIVFFSDSAAGDVSLVAAAKDVKALDEKTYSEAAATKNKIENQFDNADLKRYEPGNGNANAFEYVTRTNWAGTLPTKAVGGLARTEKMDREYLDEMGDAVRSDDRAYPAYGAENNLQLIDLRAYADDDDDPCNDVPIEYDNEMWNQLLDQLTWDDTVAILSDGLRKTAGLDGITKPETVDHNGANGIINPFDTGSNGLATLCDDPDKTANPIVYPCNAIVASAFNPELTEQYGVQWGEECLWAGYNALYGPGLNIHRSQYNGRNFEYYSEDPVLTGKCAAKISKGMSTRGAYVYLKHCVLNDQETYRNGVNTWANEQTIREIYLRPFQIAIEEGGAQCVMTSFNSIGAVWSGAHGFVNRVLRGEFGMTGHAVSDFHKEYMYRPVGIMQGNDLPDGQVNGQFDKYRTGYGELAWEMRESAHRILYTVVHSNAMNGYDANTRLVQITPVWQIAIRSVEIVCGVLFGASLALFVWQTALGYIARRKESGGGKE